MSQCPKHKSQLMTVRNGLSRVCPDCDYKEYIRPKYWLPPVRNIIDLPAAFAFSSWTLTNLTTSGSTLVLVSGQLEGTAVSPQMINLTKKSTRYLDCSQVELSWIDTRNGGFVKYFASNDSGVAWKLINKADVIWNLSYGNELRRYKQANYDDLRIRIDIRRTSVGNDSPIVTKLVVKYDKL